MDVDDILRMEDEAAERLEESFNEHHCPKCENIMIEKHSKQYGKYYRCTKCNKNYKLIN